eukprot:1081817-Prorocentrum_minimum.AAC.2
MEDRGVYLNPCVSPLNRLGAPPRPRLATSRSWVRQGWRVHHQPKHRSGQHPSQHPMHPMHDVDTRKNCM